MSLPDPDPSVTSTLPLQAASKVRPERTAYEYHLPVMLAEVVAALLPASGKLMVDGTLGGGGHTKALLDAGAKVIALDRDLGAITYCIQHLVEYDGAKLQLLRNDYRNMDSVLDDLGVDKVDGILLDPGHFFPTTR